MAKKNCFMNKERPCDLTCKAAFEVDDPVDNVDCHFIWLAYHFGEGLFDVRRMVESGWGPGGPAPSPPASGGSPGPPGSPPGPKGPKGFSSN